jgi:hypothetical protein
MPISIRVGMVETLGYTRELLNQGYEVTIIQGKKPNHFEVNGRKPPEEHTRHVHPGGILQYGDRTTN